MKAFLIILLILVILAILYFLFIKKKKTGDHEAPLEASAAPEPEAPVSEDTAAEVCEAAEEIIPLTAEEPAEAEAPAERSIPAAEACEAVEEIIPLTAAEPAEAEAPTERSIPAAEVCEAVEEIIPLAAEEPAEAEAPTEPVTYLSPVCLGEQGIDTAGKYKRIIAINLEAPNSGNNRICEFAMVYDEDGTKYSAVNLVDPEADYDRESTRAMIENAGGCPTFPALWKELYGIFDGSLVIAHNTAFDVSVLKKTLDAYGLEFPKFDVACTYRLSRKYHTELDNFKLGTVCKFYDIPLDPEDAVSHGNACYEIFRKLVAEGVPVYDEAKEFSL